MMPQQQQQQQQLPIAEVKNLMHQMCNLQNPQMATQSLLQQFPMLKPIMNLQKNGASLQQIATVMAQQKGIDLNNLIQALQS